MLALSGVGCGEDSLGSASETATAGSGPSTSAVSDDRLGLDKLITGCDMEGDDDQRGDVASIPRAL